MRRGKKRNRNMNGRKDLFRLGDDKRVLVFQPPGGKANRLTVEKIQIKIQKQSMPRCPPQVEVQSPAKPKQAQARWDLAVLLPCFARSSGAEHHPWR